MTPLLVATNNSHKTREICEILGDKCAVTDLSTHPEIPAVIESGATFKENAILKAVEVSRRFDGLVLSDDSGLEVDALGGAPGVRSARFAGEGSTDSQNRDRLLLELARLPAANHDRSARFHCVMALAQHGMLIRTFEGKVEGIIVNECHGNGGFGYDPLFVPEGHHETFAELEPEVKNRESHRARALSQVRAFLSEPAKPA